MHALASENRAIEIVVRCNYLKRAQSYAEAALRNFQQYQGRAVNEEAKTQRIIGKIKQALIQLHG